MITYFINNHLDIKWSRIIVDEISSIYLPYNFKFNANFIWLITSTPYYLLRTNKLFLKDIV